LLGRCAECAAFDFQKAITEIELRVQIKCSVLSFWYSVLLAIPKRLAVFSTFWPSAEKASEM
jgi:hypothetical protein